MALVQQDKVGDFQIVPQATAPPIPTDDWPLLLKNYDKCE
jgi:H/ACA ribonucleoprotein complex subunit 4